MEAWTGGLQSLVHVVRSVFVVSYFTVAVYVKNPPMFQAGMDLARNYGVSALNARFVATFGKSEIFQEFRIPKTLFCDFSSFDCPGLFLERKLPLVLNVIFAFAREALVYHGNLPFIHTLFHLCKESTAISGIDKQLWLCGVVDGDVIQFAVL